MAWLLLHTDHKVGRGLDSMRPKVAVRVEQWAGGDLSVQCVCRCKAMRVVCGASCWSVPAMGAAAWQLGGWRASSSRYVRGDYPGQQGRVAHWARSNTLQVPILIASGVCVQGGVPILFLCTQRRPEAKQTAEGRMVRMAEGVEGGEGESTALARQLLQALQGLVQQPDLLVSGRPSASSACPTVSVFMEGFQEARSSKRSSGYSCAMLCVCVACVT